MAQGCSSRLKANTISYDVTDYRNIIGETVKCTSLLNGFTQFQIYCKSKIRVFVDFKYSIDTLAMNIYFTCNNRCTM